MKISEVLTTDWWPTFKWIFKIVVHCCKGPLTADKRFEAHWNNWVAQTYASSWEIFIEIDCNASSNEWK